MIFIRTDAGPGHRQKCGRQHRRQSHPCVWIRDVWMWRQTSTLWKRWLKPGNTPSRWPHSWTLSVHKQLCSAVVHKGLFTPSESDQDQRTIKKRSKNKRWTSKKNSLSLSLLFGVNGPQQVTAFLVPFVLLQLTFYVRIILNPWHVLGVGGGRAFLNFAAKYYAEILRTNSGLEACWVIWCTQV